MQFVCGLKGTRVYGYFIRFWAYFWGRHTFVTKAQKAGEGRGNSGTDFIWCKRSFSKKEKFEKNEKRKIQVLSQSLFLVQEFMSFIGLISDFA